MDRIPINTNSIQIQRSERFFQTVIVMADWDLSFEPWRQTQTKRQKSKWYVIVASTDGQPFTFSFVSLQFAAVVTPLLVSLNDATDEV